MTQRELRKEYFDWMYRLVFRRPRSATYRKLLTCLYDHDFRYSIAMDDNRDSDGIDLRYRFAREKGYDYRLIGSYLDDRPCSVLEMMIALALRCEEHIMEDSEFGDRTGHWFWNMIVSLGLSSMSDKRFDIDYVDDVIERFLDREYEPNGKGGLFTVRDSKRDMRTMEIWYQMHSYLSSLE